MTHVNPNLYIKYPPGNSNEEGLKWAMLQCDQVLEQLKIMNACRLNYLKKVTNLIDGTLVTLTPYPCSGPFLNDLDGPSIGVLSQDFTRAMIKVQIPISKLTKGEIITMKSKNMVTMASWLLSTFDVHVVFFG